VCYFKGTFKIDDIEMKLKSIIHTVIIILFIIVLLVATDVIRISYCNSSLGLPCKGQKNNTTETIVSQTTIPPALQEDTQPENPEETIPPQTTLLPDSPEKPAQADETRPVNYSNTPYLPVQCPAFDDVAKEIEDANYCAADKDCLVTFFGCPFGCGGYVNAKTDIPALKARIDKYYECMDINCVNNCIPVPEPICVNNKCIGNI
jgi:hypothetical protein